MVSVVYVYKSGLVYQVKVGGANLLESRHQSLLSEFIFDDCPLIGLALNAILCKYLALLLKILVAPLLAISGEQGCNYTHS
jgi:hypothetical protein